MLISELAKATGTTKDTIRHYHQQGLLIAKKRAAGTCFYNDYSSENIARVANVRQGKALGFTLKEIASLQKAYYSGKLSSQDRLEILNDKLLLVESKIVQLDRIKKSIEGKLSTLPN